MLILILQTIIKSAKDLKWMTSAEKWMWVVLGLTFKLVYLKGTSIAPSDVRCQESSARLDCWPTR